VWLGGTPGEGPGTPPTPPFDESSSALRILDGIHSTAMRFISPGPTTVGLGAMDRTMSVLSWWAPDDPSPWSLQYNKPAPGWWGLIHANSDYRIPLAFWGYPGPGPTPARVWAPYGLYLGGSWPRRKVTYSDAEPPHGTWEQGDVLFNSNPTLTGYVGWVCVTSGTAGAYAEGRTATSDGTNVITLDAPSGVLQVGDFVVLNSLTARITSIDGPRITLTQSIPTGPGLSIAHAGPTWKKYGALEP
jgi:hypothetical protein